MAGVITDLIDRVSDSSTGRPIIATLAAPGKSIGAASINLVAATNWTTSSAIHFSIYETTTVGSTVVKDASTQTDWKGTLSGVAIGNLTLTGGTDRAYTAGAIVELTPTSRYAKDLYDWAMTGHNQNGTHKAFTESSIVPTAAIQDSAVSGVKLAGTYKVVRQDNTTNSTETTARILTGWGVMTPGATPTAVESVTFNSAFTTAPIVTVTFGGDHASASTYGSGGNNIKQGIAEAYGVSTTGFTVLVTSKDTSPWAVGNTVFYQWIAIGN